MINLAKCFQVANNLDFMAMIQKEDFNKANILIKILENKVDLEKILFNLNFNEF